MEGAWMRHQQIHMAALPLQGDGTFLEKVVSTLHKEIPRHWPIVRPMAVIVGAASSLQPPGESTTSGMKVSSAE